MAEVNEDGVYLRVDLNYNGVFIRHAYTRGEHHLFTDVDFASMNMRECVAFLEQFTGEVVEALYYCQRDRPLSTGIRHIGNDGEYAVFLDEAYEDPDTPISLYIDHTGDALEEWFDSSTDGTDGSVVQDEETEEALFKEAVNKSEGQENIQDGTALEDEITPEEFNHRLNRTGDDTFLNKLCPERKEGQEGESNDEDDVVVHPRYNPNLDWKAQKPILGMRFNCPQELKSMLCNYVVTNGYQLSFKKNDKKRLMVMCSKGECTFRLWASWMSEEHSFQIKSLISDHQCGRNFKVGSIVTFKWIGAHYVDDILHKQKLTIRQLRLEVIKKFGIHVSLSQCRRAKKHALNIIEGTLVEHYAKLWSYAEEIRRSNPGSTIKMGVKPMPDGKTYFERFYVCFEGVKKGWLAGCRKIVGIDGCFLKGFCIGELLCVVGRDGNNQIYPVAWTVVSIENKENWKWFLELLIDDLNLGEGHGFTIMSDQHKGLLEAVKDLLPMAEHRQCARHIVANFSKRFPGAEFEDLFWKACLSSTQSGFNQVMQKLHEFCPPAHKFLMDKDPKTWSRAYYQTGRCCDAVENGCSESFNAVIVEARKKPIIAMLEELRIYMMEKLYHSKNKKWSRLVSPSIRTKFVELKAEQRFWHVLPSGLENFEARSGSEAYEVDLGNRTCGCRIWQLNGYGCVHSVAAISYLNREVEDYVDPCFTRDMYMKTYQYSINPMNGSSLWPPTTYIPPLAPKSRRMPGRPKTKRIRGPNERVGKHRVSKKGVKMTCSLCHVLGHNKTKCPTKSTASKLPVKRNKKDKTKNSKVKKPKDVASSSGIIHEGFGGQTSVDPTFIEEEEPRVGAIEVEDPRVDAMADGGTQGEGIGVVTQSDPTTMGDPISTMEFVVGGRNATPAVAPRKRKSERITKAKLGRNMKGKNGEGNTPTKPITLEAN